MRVLCGCTPVSPRSIIRIMILLHTGKHTLVLQAVLMTGILEHSLRLVISITNL